MRDDARFLLPFVYGVKVIAAPGLEQRCPSCGARYELVAGRGITLCPICLDELESDNEPMAPTSKRISSRAVGAPRRVEPRHCGILMDAHPGEERSCRRCSVTYTLLAGPGWARCAACFDPLLRPGEKRWNASRTLPDRPSRRRSTMGPGWSRP